MKRILIPVAALMLAASLMVPAFAEDTATNATDSSTTLTDAQNAYKSAKQATDLTDYEAELKAMVEAGSLTQEQADLLLTAAKESVALRSGVCPNCGYEFQYATTGKNGRGYGKINGKMNRNQASSTASDDSTALEQAQDAYNTAKQNSQLTDYEAELKAMVEAGTLTQDQADTLLAAAKEANALANGTCPNCGYQFQTTTSVNSGHGNGMTNGKGHGGKH